MTATFDRRPQVRPELLQVIEEERQKRAPDIAPDASPTLVEAVPKRKAAPKPRPERQALPTPCHPGLRAARYAISSADIAEHPEDFRCPDCGMLLDAPLAVTA